MRPARRGHLRELALMTDREVPMQPSAPSGDDGAALSNVPGRNDRGNSDRGNNDRGNNDRGNMASAAFHPSDEVDRLGDGLPRSSNDRVLYCFRCHRDDRHFHGLRGTWYFNIVLGFSLGLILLLGPFRCRCCGGWRMMSHDMLSPRFWMESLRFGPAGSSRRRFH